jgi:hypothetical protein
MRTSARSQLARRRRPRGHRATRGEYLLARRQTSASVRGCLVTSQQRIGGGFSQSRAARPGVRRRTFDFSVFHQPRRGSDRPAALRRRSDRAAAAPFPPPELHNFRSLALCGTGDRRSNQSVAQTSRQGGLMLSFRADAGPGGRVQQPRRRCSEVAAVVPLSTIDCAGADKSSHGRRVAPV